jgi:hypothetical protein
MYEQQFKDAFRRRCGACGRTGAQRLRERAAHAAPVRVPVELAGDCVPEAPSGVVRVIVTAIVCRARDGRQALARRLGLEPRIVCGAAVAACAADLEGCTAIHPPPRGRLRHSSAKRAAQRTSPGRAGHAPRIEDERPYRGEG